MKHSGSFTSETAAKSARAGGIATAAIPGRMQMLGRLGGKKVSENRQHMSEIGTKGGYSKAKKRAEAYLNELRSEPER